VLPLEKIMVARSSNEPGVDRPSAFSSSLTGKSHAIRRAAIFSPALGGPKRIAVAPGAATLLFSADGFFPAISSRKKVWQGIESFTFSRKSLEVMTVLISHWRMQEAKVASETV
jgi:hypothetical protein